MSADARYYQRRMSAVYGVPTTVSGRTLVVGDDPHDQEMARLFAETWPEGLQVLPGTSDGELLIEVR